MTDVPWFSQRGPGDVYNLAATVDAAPAPTPPRIAVMTEGRQLFIRSQGSAPAWEFLGVPPGASGVSAVACVTTDAAGTMTPLVVSGDTGHVWLAPTDPTSGWLDLGSPAPDTEVLEAITLRRGSVLRHVLIVTADSRHVWLHEGLDPDGTWFALTATEDWKAVELAFAMGSPGPGEPPQLHIFAIVTDQDGFTPAVRVGVRENSVWNWIDPGQKPSGDPPNGLSAASALDTAGAVQACALFGVGTAVGDPDTVWLLRGGGRTWQWDDLGHPLGDGDLRDGVLADGVPATGGPTVLARVGHHYARRSAATDWQDLGLPLDGDTSILPYDCVQLTEPRAQVIGVGDSRLWTVDADGPTATWHDHGIPVKVDALVGASTELLEPDNFGPTTQVFVLDEHARLWQSHFDTNQLYGWDPHDRPSPALGCRVGVGVLTIRDMDAQRTWAFVVGSDNHLWAREGGPGGWAWVEHGAPAGRTVRTALAPIAVDPFVGEPTVPVVADDGQLWLRTWTGAAWQWVARGAPPGQLIFAPVGAVRMPTAQGTALVTAVVSDDGRLWINGPQGAAAPWTDLGAPAAGERVAAGIGADVATGANGDVTAHFVVVTAPAGHVWTRTWAPGASSIWTDLGRPGDLRIDATVGVVRNPDDPASARVFVLARGEVWVRPSVGGVAGWAAWGRPSPSEGLTGGRVALVDERVAAVMADASTGQLWVKGLWEF